MGLPLVAGARLPLAFIALGLAALAIAVLALALEPHLLLLPHVHPSVVAVAHLWLPGFLLSVTLGATYQLMPVVLGAALRLPLAAAWTHFGLHAVGIALLIGGFAIGRFDVVGLGGVAIAAGVGIVLFATWRTFLSSARRDAIGWSFPLAVSWLAATVLFGVTLAVNRRAPFLPLSVVDLLKAHAHVGLGGFFLTLLQGATFQLVPMFTMADLRQPRLVRAGLALSQAGLLALVPGLACGRAGVALVGAAGVAAGVASSGVALVATFRSRRRRTLEPGLKAFAFGAIVLGAAALCGLVSLLLPGGTASAERHAFAYGTLVIAGALSTMVLGMLCKIVPFLVWMKTYGPRAGRQIVPLATSLGSRALERAWIKIHAAALLSVLVGIVTGSLAVLTIGTTLLATAIALFLVNTARVLGHMWAPPSTPTPRPTATIPASP